jgi:hypothetical protein
MEADEYGWWRATLLAMAMGTPRPPIHEGHPEPGRYKWRKRIDYRVYGPWLPAAIWRYGDHIKCLVDGEERNAADEWIWLAQNPISQEDYHFRMTTGVWPEECARSAQKVVISEPSKVFKKFSQDADILARLSALCEKYYIETGKLAPGSELKEEATAS